MAKTEKNEKLGKSSSAKGLGLIRERKNELRSLVQELMKTTPNKKILMQLSAQVGVEFHQDTSILMSNILHEMSPVQGSTPRQVDPIVKKRKVDETSL